MTERGPRNWLRLGLPVGAALLFSWPGLWQALNPLPYRGPLTRAARQAGISPYWVAAVVRVESRGNPRARSRRGAVGLMQLMPETARWVATRMGLSEYRAGWLEEPGPNLRLGSWYLAYLRRLYGGDMTLALAAYNAGEGTVAEWVRQGQWTGSPAELSRIPYPETRQFVRLVEAGYGAYRRLYDRALWWP